MTDPWLSPQALTVTRVVEQERERVYYLEMELGRLLRMAREREAVAAYLGGEGTTQGGGRVRW